MNRLIITSNRKDNEMTLNRCYYCKGDAEWFLQDKQRTGMRFYHFGERVPIGPYTIICDKCKRNKETT